MSCRTRVHLSPDPPTLCCICVLKLRTVLPLSLECWITACTTLREPCRSCCLRFSPLPCGSCSLDHTAFGQPVVHSEALCSFCLRQQQSSLHLGALMAGVCISDSCLLLHIILSNDNWLASVSISKACLEVLDQRCWGVPKPMLGSLRTTRIHSRICFAVILW